MCLKGLTIPHNLSLPKKISQRRKLGCRWRPAPPSHHVRYGMEHWKIPSEFSTLQWLAQFNCTFRWCGVHNFVHLSLSISRSLSLSFDMPHSSFTNDWMWYLHRTSSQMSNYDWSTSFILIGKCTTGLCVVNSAGVCVETVTATHTQPQPPPAKQYTMMICYPPSMDNRQQ